MSDDVSDDDPQDPAPYTRGRGGARLRVWSQRALRLLDLQRAWTRAAAGAAMFLPWAAGTGDPNARLTDAGDRIHALPGASVAPSDASRERLRVMTFNIAYGRGPVEDVDGLRDRATLLRKLEAIADAIEREDPDVVALQEVDVASRRAAFLDQGAWLQEALGWPWYADVTVWQVRYVPHPLWPPRHHYGRAHMVQAVLSRHPIVHNRRLRLPQPAAWSRIYRAFYLHRALQWVRLNVHGRPLDLFNAHLEAYATRNRAHQAHIAAAFIRDHACPDAILAGDLNALPPDATRRTDFVDEPHIRFDADRTWAPLTRLLPAWDDALTAAGHPDGPETWTFPADVPTRRLDAILAPRARFAVDRAYVPHHMPAVSDHLPVVADLRWRET